MEKEAKTKIENEIAKAMKFTDKEIPWLYAGCIKADCKMADVCLRKKVMERRTATNDKIMIVNQQHVTGDKDCKEFRSARPRKYAVGFTNFKERMFPAQYRCFKDLCISHWSRNEYFRRRRGVRLIPPEEQSFIKRALRQAGVTDDFDFDGYTYHIDWDNR